MFIIILKCFYYLIFFFYLCISLYIAEIILSVSEPSSTGIIDLKQLIVQLSFNLGWSAACSNVWILKPTIKLLFTNLLLWRDKKLTFSILPHINKFKLSHLTSLPSVLNGCVFHSFLNTPQKESAGLPMYDDFLILQGQGCCYLSSN